MARKTSKAIAKRNQTPQSEVVLAFTNAGVFTDDETAAIRERITQQPDTQKFIQKQGRSAIRLDVQIAKLDEAIAEKKKELRESALANEIREMQTLAKQLKQKRYDVQKRAEGAFMGLVDGVSKNEPGYVSIQKLLNSFDGEV